MLYVDNADVKSMMSGNGDLWTANCCPAFRLHCSWGNFRRMQGLEHNSVQQCHSTRDRSALQGKICRHRSLALRVSSSTKQLLRIIHSYPGNSFQHAPFITFPESVPSVQSIHCGQTKSLIPLSDDFAHFPRACVDTQAALALLGFNKVMVVSRDLDQNIDWCSSWRVRCSICGFWLCKVGLEGRLEAC